jgi:hypothetical protein
MAVPEAAMNENDLPSRGEYHVRTTRQVATMKAKPVAKRVSELAHDHFRFGVLVSNTGHERTSLRKDWLVVFRIQAVDSRPRGLLHIEDVGPVG